MLERRPPAKAAKQVVALERGDTFLWSPDRQRALVEEAEPFLVGISSGKRTALPSSPATSTLLRSPTSASRRGSRER